MNDEANYPHHESSSSSVGEEEEEEEVNEEENEEEDDEEREVKGEEEIMLPPPKRPRSETLDRISALHDSLILHILSFLSMKDVVRTGTLSKRWEYLWTYLSTLVFKRDEVDIDDIGKFVAFVNRTLLLCRCTHIKKFEIEFMFEPHDFPEDANLWIRFATQNNVEDLYLLFRGFPSANRLPQHLFTNSSLVTLIVSSCVIAPIGEISWISLKSLTLEAVELRNGAIEKILSGCPVLEFLKLDIFCATCLLDVSSASLKKLVIQNIPSRSESSGKHVLEISAPNLLVLELLGYFGQHRFRLVNVSSLVKANLKFSGEDYSDDHENRRNQLLELLEKLQHVKELHLWNWSLQVLSVGDVKGLPSPMLSCKIVTLHTHVMKWDVPGIVSVLQCSPYIEKLVVELSSKGHSQFSFCKKYLDSCNFDGQNPWTSRKTTYCPLLHLKTIEIVGFKEVHEGSVLPLVQFLLLNAMVLEKMVIEIGNLGYNQCSKCSLSQEFFRLTEKLLSFPRASPRAAILFAY